MNVRVSSFARLQRPMGDMMSGDMMEEAEQVFGRRREEEQVTERDKKPGFLSKLLSTIKVIIRLKSKKK